jgi:hypothetical protein
MLAPMDLAATSAGPWLVLGAVVGALLAGLVALAVLGLRQQTGTHRASEPSPQPSPADGWSVDDLPGFLEHPPGTPRSRPAATDAEVRLSGGPVLLDAPVRPARTMVARSTRDDRTATRLLITLAAAAVLLVGAAAAVAAMTGQPRGTTSAAPAGPTAPSWKPPDVSGIPAQPSPDDPGAGRLAAASVPVGPDGALARAAFAGVVLERRAVGVTVTYPVVSVTVGEVPGGPALAHVRLPVWNCLRDAAPPDPVAAGCRRLPVLHAELGTPELSVSSDGDGLRIEGRFPTYVRPTGSAPVWTGDVYPLAVTWSSDGGTLHLGDERGEAVDDPRITELRLGR